MCMKKRLLIRFGLLFAVLLIARAVAFANGGGLDSLGCHHDRKRGGYHLPPGIPGWAELCVQGRGAPCLGGSAGTKNRAGQNLRLSIIASAGRLLSAPNRVEAGDEDQCHKLPSDQ